MQYIKGIDVYYENYLRIRNNHILINPDMNAVFIKLYKNIIISDNTILENQKIHLFICKYDSKVNESIIYILKHFSAGCKIVIHIPKLTKDLKITLENDIEEFVRINKIEYPVCKIITERSGPSFKVHGKNWSFVNDSITDIVNIVYSNKGIHISYSIFDVKYSNYTYHELRISKKPGAVRTKPQRDNPELFKDLIIKQFKEATPDGILKAFKNDNEIWDYILGNGEWKVLGVDNGSKTKDNGGKK